MACPIPYGSYKEQKTKAAEYNGLPYWVAITRYHLSGLPYSTVVKMGLPCFLCPYYSMRKHAIGNT